MLDLAGAKMAVVQKRAEAKDYLDVDALLRHVVPHWRRGVSFTAAGSIL
jgi:hypothetical protein